MLDNSALCVTARRLAIPPATLRVTSKECKHCLAMLASLFQRGLSLNGHVHWFWSYDVSRFLVDAVGIRIRGSGTSNCNADTFCRC